MMELRRVNTYYGQSHILHDMDLTVQANETIGLLGRNGAGKTTTLRTVCGLTRARSGTVHLDGADIRTRKAHLIARAGVVYVPAGRRAFADLTVDENLIVTAKGRPARRHAARWTIPGVLEVFPALGTLRHRRAGVLSGGEQQMLKLARALLCQPRLLLLDEPSEGLAPVVVHDLARTLGALATEEGLTMLLCEQNLRFTLDLADRCYLLEKGTIRMHDTSDQLRDNPEAQRYLGI